MWQQKPEYDNSSDQDFQHLMMMPMTFNNGLLIVPIHNKPGYASVSGARFNHRPIEVTLTEAERLKDQDIRSMFGLESQNEMSQRQAPYPQKCKFCGQSCTSRCTACRMNYCSRICQSKDWFRHVFVCCVKNRPNDVDYLKLRIREWRTVNDSVSQAQFLTNLFRDDHLCKTFGFNDCAQEAEVINLLCIYDRLTSGSSSKRLQHFVEQQTLRNFVEIWIRCQLAQTNTEEPGDFQWLLSQHQLLSFDVPNHGGPYLYQDWGEEILEKVFSINNDSVLTRPELTVALLYRILLRDFNNIPNIGDPEWIRFGFYYCKSRAQMELLVDTYLQLAVHASLSQIATAWESDTLLDLMATKSITTSALVSDVIYPRQPSPETIGIYRLMSEVSHGLSGCQNCSCKNVVCESCSKNEPFLCEESEVDYGFHSTNTWERWRLLIFYSDLFAHLKFDPEKMQKAKRSPDVKALETYIESLIPKFRRTLWNEHLTGGMFPRLSFRLDFGGNYPSCTCFIHRFPMSEGMDHGTNTAIELIRHQYEKRNEGKMSQS